jgi:uncharacterized membrane protein YphA (DoxX/SURF4 family)
MSAIWLIVRLCLGYQWTNAGYQKIWGSERSAFWFGGGASVKGFATAGVLGSTTGKGGATMAGGQRSSITSCYRTRPFSPRWSRSVSS